MVHWKMLVPEVVYILQITRLVNIQVLWWKMPILLGYSEWMKNNDVTVVIGVAIALAIRYPEVVQEFLINLVVNRF
jgi:uncharacterized membrane protein YwzB